jgi:hypothetical protein
MSLLRPLLPLAGVLLLASHAAALTPTPTSTQTPTPSPTPTPTLPPVVLTPAQLSVSTQDGNNGPANVIDNNLGTRWSGYGEGAWLKIDLGGLHVIERLLVAAYRGNERKNRFDIQTSVDGTFWNTAVMAESSGLSTSLERYDVPSSTIRYVRYLGHGSRTNAGESLPWNSVTEVRVFARPFDPGPPVRPSNLRAIPAAGRVALTWTPQPARFRIERRLSQCDTFTALGTSDIPAFADATVIDGQHYYYRVIAFDARGESEPSEPVAVTPQLQPPGPTTLQATAGPIDSGRINLAWTPLPGVTRYVLRRSVRQACTLVQNPSTVLATIDAPATTFVDTTPQPGRTYVYSVAGVNAAGEGARSNVPSALVEVTGATPTPTSTPCPTATATPSPRPPTQAPSAPIALTATSSDRRVRLLWQDGFDAFENRATSWYVYRGLPACGPFRIVARGLTAREYIDRDVVNGTTYSYFLVGVNALGESLDSDVVSAIPEAVVPLKPTNVTVFGFVPSPGALTARVQWRHGFTADSYLVKRATSSGGPYDTLASVPAPASPADATLLYDDATAAPLTDYFYVVVGVNGAGPGPASDEVPFRFEPPVIPTPTPTPNPSLRADPGPGTVSLRWSPIAGASQYEVRRRTNLCGPWSPLVTVGSSPFSDHVAWPTRFYYEVAALTPSGPAGYRAVGSAPLNGASTSPVGFTTTSVSAGEVRLAWQPRADAVFWRLYRRQSPHSVFCPPSPPAKVLATVSGTSYIDSMVSSGVTYTYELAAVVAGGGEDGHGFLTVPIPGSSPGGPCPSSSGGAIPQTTPTLPPPPPQDVPNAPTGLVATAGHQQVRLSWSGVNEAYFGYRVYRAANACGPFTWVGSSSLNGQSFTDTGLVNGAPYHYIVSAWNSLGEGAESTGVGAAAAPRPPSDGPEMQQVDPRPEGVFVRWAPVYGATAFVVKRRTLPSGTFADLGPATGDAFLDITVTPGVAYAYVVAGTNDFGEGPVSPYPMQTIAAPGFVEITPPASRVTASTNDGNLPGRVVDNNLATRWSGNGDGAWLNLDLGTIHQVGYVKMAVYRGNERRNDFELWLSADGVTWNQYRDASSGGTLEEELYEFPDQPARHVRYVGHGALLPDGSRSPWNSVTEVSVFGAAATPTPTPTPPPTCSTPPPLPTPPLPPSNVTATPGDGRITVSWDVAFSRYRVLRSLSSGGPYTQVADVTVTGPRASWIDTDVTNGTRYFYVVHVWEQRTGGGPPPCPQWTWTNRSPNSAEVDAVPGAAATCTRIVLQPPQVIINASGDDGNVPANAVDDNLSTRWTGPGDGAWLRIDLGSTRSVCGVKIAFYRGNERVYRFDIQTSNDAATWTTALQGQSSGTTNGLETFDIVPDRAARWVRYLGHGSNVNANNNITEIQIYGGTGSP